MKILGYEISRLKYTPNDAPKNQAKTGRSNPAIINIAQSFKDNARKEIDSWRKALLMASHPENPKLVALYDLIDNLRTDGHLQSQIQMRKMSTLNTDFQIINRNTGEPNTELNFIFQQQWFYNFLEICLDSILYGPSIVEFAKFDNEKIEMGIIPRRNTAPALHRVYPDVAKDDYIDIRNPKLANWVLLIGGNDQFGLINNIIPNLIWKRNVAQSWAEFCERFGLPLVTATTTSNQPDVINKAHEMLLAVGEAGVGVFPHGTEIKYLEANRTDAYQVYQQFLQTNADEISKQLVGSTMLSDQGSNRSQTEVHERSLDYKISQADKRMIQFVVNDLLFPLMQRQGYRIGPEDVFEFKTAEQETDLSQMWQITSGLLNNGYEVEQEWISKTFNIPLGAKKKIQPPNISANFFENNPINTMQTEERYAFSCNCEEHNLPIAAGVNNRLNQLTKQLIKAVFHSEDHLGIYGNLVVTEALYLVKALRDNFKTQSPYVGQDQLVLQMMEYNLFEFSASKTEARLASMMENLVDEKGQLRSFEDFENICATKVKNFNEDWLRAEYNLSIAVGQNSAAYIRFLAEKDSVTAFVQYQTIGDDSVRDSHRVLDGKVFSLDDKEAMQLFPPNGYGCRCEMLQYLGNEKPIKGTEAKNLIYANDTRYKASQFEINRGDLKQVFTQKQFYSDIKGLPEKLNQMTFDKYGLEKWADFKDALKPIVLDESITGKNVDELFKKVKNTQYMGFEDYLGRKMILNENDFKTHTKDYYLNDKEKRHQLFPHVNEVLQNPDEVWYYEKFEGGNTFQTRYVKFYNNITLIVECYYNTKNGIEIKTWYPLKIDETKIRKGLKIK